MRIEGCERSTFIRCASSLFELLLLESESLLLLLLLLKLDPECLLDRFLLPLARFFVDFFSFFEDPFFFDFFGSFDSLAVRDFPPPPNMFRFSGMPSNSDAVVAEGAAVLAIPPWFSYAF